MSIKGHINNMTVVKLKKIYWPLTNSLCCCCVVTLSWSKTSFYSFFYCVDFDFIYVSIVPKASVEKPVTLVGKQTLLFNYWMLFALAKCLFNANWIDMRGQSIVWICKWDILMCYNTLSRDTNSQLLLDRCVLMVDYCTQDFRRILE